LALPAKPLIAYRSLSGRRNKNFFTAIVKLLMKQVTAPLL